MDGAVDHVVDILGAAERIEPEGEAEARAEIGIETVPLAQRGSASAACIRKRARSVAMAFSTVIAGQRNTSRAAAPAVGNVVVCNPSTGVDGRVGS